MRIPLIFFERAQFYLNCFLAFDPIGVLDAICHGLWFLIRLKVTCNLGGKNNVDNCSLSVEWFSRINRVGGNFVYPLWLFYISQSIGAKVFWCPSIYICAYICPRNMVYLLNIYIIWIFLYPIWCLSTWCWFAFTVLELVFLGFSGGLSFVTVILPLLFWSGRFLVVPLLFLVLCNQ